MSDTLQPRTAGQKRKPAVTLPGVDSKIKALTAGHDSTKSRVTSLEDKVTAQLSIHAKSMLLVEKRAIGAHKKLSKHDQRIAALEATIGSLDLVGNTIAAQQTGNVKRVITILQEANCSTDQIAKALVILKPEATESLTNEEFLAELFTAFMTHKDAVNEELKSLDARVTDTHTRVEEVHSAQVQGFTEIRKEITEVRTASETPKWALPVAAVLGLIAALVWGNHEFKETVAVNVGDKFGSAELAYNPLNSWIAATLFGLFVFALVMIFASFTGSKTTTTQDSESTTSTTQDSSKSKTSTLFNKLRRSNKGDSKSKNDSTTTQESNAPEAPAQGHAASPAPASAPASV